MRILNVYCCTIDHPTSGTKYNVPPTMRSFLNTPPVMYSIRAWHRRSARESWLSETGFCNFRTTCNRIGVIVFIRPRRPVYYTHLRCSIINIDRVTFGYWGKKIITAIVVTFSFCKYKHFSVFQSRNMRTVGWGRRKNLLWNFTFL